MSADRDLIHQNIRRARRMARDAQAEARQWQEYAEKEQGRLDRLAAKEESPVFPGMSIGRPVRVPGLGEGSLSVVEIDLNTDERRNLVVHDGFHTVPARSIWRIGQLRIGPRTQVRVLGGTISEVPE